MQYSETIEPIPAAEKKKLHIILIVLSILPFVFGGVGYALREVEFFWAVFCWIAAAMLVVLFISRAILFIRDDYFRNKIVYKGIIKEVNPVKIGYGTSSSICYDLVLEKKTLKISESALVETNLPDVPLPAQGEEVEIHALPKSGDIIRLLVRRNGRWDAVLLK